ncbi:MAG: cystathionine beta-lyase [Gemmatimonadaceae bacterium]
MSDGAEKGRRYAMDTLLAHLGGDPADRQGAVNPPVYRASTFLFETASEWDASREHARRFDIIRYGQLATPTTVALEEAIAAIEGGYRAMLVPSGLAAVTVALQALVWSGDHILVADTVYPPTRIFCDGTLRRFGVEVTYYDPLIGAGIGALCRENTRLVFLESPGSMTFEIQDVPAIARAAHARNIHVLLDNSWATPLYFPAMEHGVDVSILAATKYIGGHSDVMMGTITTTKPLYERIRTAVAESGFCVSSDDAYLALRGLRTLALRLERHQRNALHVSKWLTQQPDVVRVTYPALTSAPGHALWKRDFRGASGLFGVELRPVPKRAVDAMLNALELFGMGASFGGFESLAIPLDPRPYRSVTRWTHDGPLIRLHVGLEDPDDLVADLERGLACLREAAS